MKGVGLGTLLLIALFVAFPLAIASMVSGLGSTGSSGPGLPGNSTVGGTSGGTLSVDLSQLGNSKVALILIVAVILLEAPLLFRSRMNILWELLTFGASVVAAVVAIVVVVGLTKLQGAGLEISIEGGLYFVLAAIIGLTVAGALAAVLLIRRSRGMAVVGVPPSRPRRLRPGVTPVVMAPYYGTSGVGYRGVVISCYSAFCALLMKLGVGNPPSRTPREFAAEASERTALDRGMGRRITALFEKARYSGEEVVENDAKESQDILDAIKGELGTGTGT